MTDTTATTNTILWLPEDVWGLIASFLDDDDLARFRQVRKLFDNIGSHSMVLQPLYNRLYAMDKTLPAALPEDGTVLAFNQAFKKIQARQQEEIAYLTQDHPAVMAKPEYVQALQENSSVSLKSLEAKNSLLDAMNSEIITAKIIDINSTRLDLRQTGITRLPVTLFQVEGYVNFWKKLITLNCSFNQLTALNAQGLVALQRLDCAYNQLTALNVQGLAALQILSCSYNQLTELNVQGLVGLQELWCTNNQLTELNVQGLVALQSLNCCKNQLTELNLQGLVALQILYCDKNPLTDLNLTGVSAAVKNKFAEQERSLLFKRLSTSDSAQVRQTIIARLGADYTYKNCLYYCPVYAAKLFISDSVNQVYNLASSALSQFSAYLPSSSANNNAPVNSRKRPSDETQEQDDNQMKQEENSSATQEKEPGDEPSAKRSKKS